MQATMIHRYLVSWTQGGQSGHSHLDLSEPWRTSTATIEVMDRIKTLVGLRERPVITSVFDMGIHLIERGDSDETLC